MAAPPSYDQSSAYPKQDAPYPVHGAQAPTTGFAPQPPMTGYASPLMPAPGSLDV